VRHLRLTGIVLGFAATVAPAAAPAEEGFDRAARIEEVRRAELAFAASVTENRPERFARCSPRTAVFVGGGGVTRGREAIVAACRATSASSGRGSSGTRGGRALADGSLGLTRGP